MIDIILGCVAMNSFHHHQGSQDDPAIRMTGQPLKIAMKHKRESRKVANIQDVHQPSPSPLRLRN